MGFGDQRTIVRSVVGFTLLWLASGSGAQLPLATGGESEVTEDGLHRVDPSVMDGAWVRPDFDLTRYTKVFFMPAGVQFRDVSDRAGIQTRRESVTEFPVSAEMRNQLSEFWGETFYEDLSEVEPYEVQDGVGRDVLMVQGFLIDVVSGIPPVTAASNVSFVRYPWSASIVLELRDSMSNDLLARTADRRRTEGPIEVAAVRGHTRAMVRRWSTMLCDHLEELSKLSGL